MFGLGAQVVRQITCHQPARRAKIGTHDGGIRRAVAGHADQRLDDALPCEDAVAGRGAGMTGSEPRFEVYSGDDWATFGYVCLGAVGVVSVAVRGWP